MVSLSNLQRQILFGAADVGAPKVARAAAALARLNPHVAVEAHDLRLDAGNAAALVGGYDLVLDGTDNFATRYLVNAACVAAGKPLVAAAMSQWEGQISLYDPARGGPCYECLFPEAPAAGLAPRCAEAGVVGALPGVMGSLMALEAIKLIARRRRGPARAAADLRRALRRDAPDRDPRAGRTARSAAAPGRADGAMAFRFRGRR